MSMKISIGIAGIKAVQAKMAKLAKKMDSAISKAILKGALDIESDAKKATPVKTGRLRSSITHTNPVKDMKGNWDARVGTNVEYAPHVEFGTSKMGARSYLYFALNRNFSTIQDLIKKIIRGVR